MRRSLIVLLLLLFSSRIFAADPSGKDTVKIGVYITSLYDLKFNEESYNVEFWLWFHYKNDSLHPMESTEMMNAKECEASFKDTELKEGIYWATEKYRAEIKNPWVLKNFPFDRQCLKIELEEADLDTSGMVYIADKKNSTYDSAIDVSGWKIVDFNINSTNKTYNTTYGDPELTGGSSTYPRIEISFIIEREGWGLFIKLFTGVYMALLISLLVFFIDPIDLDPRFGLSVGGVFAAIGNKYIVDSILPETITFTLVDIIHDLAFVYILLSIVLSVISLFVYKRGKEKQSRIIDLSSFFFLLVTFIILNIYFIYNAIN